MYSVVIPCAGVGKRMGLGYNKLLYQLDGQTIIEKTVNIFVEDKHCSQIILVISLEDEPIMKKIFAHYLKVEFVLGGKERQDSVYNGLQKVKESYVMIHDGARPFLSKECIMSLLECLQTHDACLPMVAVKETVKKVENGKVIKTINRNELMLAQTPQAFRLQTIMEAHQEAKKLNILATDDASLVEQLGKDVYVVNGDYSNIKITTIEDLHS